MANTSRVNGFNPIVKGSDGPTGGKVGIYFVQAADATAIYIGDLVKFDGSSDATGIASVTKVATTTVPIAGAVVGVSIIPGSLDTPQYRAASVARYVYVSDDPAQIFEVQSSNGTPAVTDVGMNATFADAGGSTITGMSGETVDFGTLTTLNTAQLQIVGFTQRSDNAVGANAKVLVRINLHKYRSATGSLGE
jgi:hypothetical protein